MGEYLASWLAGKQSLRPSARPSYELHIRKYLVPHLGDLPLSELRPGHIERMYRAIGSGDPGREAPPSVATLRRIHATLTSALNTAVCRSAGAEPGRHR